MGAATAPQHLPQISLLEIRAHYGSSLPCIFDLMTDLQIIKEKSYITLPVASVTESETILACLYVPVLLHCLWRIISIVTP
jgi:hypothetical protein